ncbi:hypothetical protein H0H81_005116 [Sphagnurus paluster]|uniref:Uncharacterized protein n=1 Tax=Sphagnurus paluster TaxID=117069 RepID=A0A9P7FY94_9AGAR|nr:hypothetical protein H0H81_005116 [Sphagnurus paluster]
MDTTDNSTSGSKYLPLHGAIRTLHRRRGIHKHASNLKDLCVWSGPQIPTTVVPVYSSDDGTGSTTTNQDMRPPPHSAPASFFGTGTSVTGYAGRVQEEIENLRAACARAMGRERRERGSWKAHCAAQIQSRGRDVFGGERSSRRSSASSSAGGRAVHSPGDKSRSLSPASWSGSSSSSNSVHLLPESPAFRSRKSSWASSSSSSLHSHSPAPSSSATAFSNDLDGPSAWLRSYIQEDEDSLSEPEVVSRAPTFTPPTRCHSAPPILSRSNVALLPRPPPPLPASSKNDDGRYQYHAPGYSAVELPVFDSDDDEEFVVETEEQFALSPTTQEHRLLLGPRAGVGQGEERRPLVRFGQKHIDVLFITTAAKAAEVEWEGEGEGGEIKCRICLRWFEDNPGCPEASRAAVLGTFPGDAPWDELFDHCTFTHPIELGRVARTSAEELAHRRIVGI